MPASERPGNNVPGLRHTETSQEEGGRIPKPQTGRDMRYESAARWIKWTWRQEPIFPAAVQPDGCRWGELPIPVLVFLDFFRLLIEFSVLIEFRVSPCERDAAAYAIMLPGSSARALRYSFDIQ